MANTLTKAFKGTLDALQDFSRGTDPVNSGTYEALMPNVGDWYYREGQSGGPEVYIRQSPTVVEKLNPNEWSSSASLTFTPEVPTATDIHITNSGGSNLSSTKLVGYSVTAYAKCEYNSAVSGALDNTPRAYFSGSVVSNTYKDLDGTDNTLTTSGLSIASNARDEGLTVNWTGTNTAGANITDGGEDVVDSAGTDSMYFRNLVIWGSCAGNTDAAILSGIDARAGTSASVGSSGGSDFGTAGTTGYICQFSYDFVSNYSSDDPIYEREWTIPAGSYFLIAYPEDNQNNISSILLDGFQGDYAGDCNTGTVTYENDLGFSESYRYHISTEIFNASTTVKMTKAR